MRVYEATVIDKCASPSGEEPVSFESYVAVGTQKELDEIHEAMELLQTDKVASTEYGDVITNDDIHYYFTEDEFKPVNGEIETKEFKYLIGKGIDLL